MQCNARSKRSGEQCRNQAVGGSTKCRMHGGNSLTGVASPRFKHGRYSKFLPERLAGRYTEALSDPKLLELRDEIALIGTRQSELLEHLEAGPSLQHWKDAKRAHQEALAAIAGTDSAAFQVAMMALGAALDAGAGEYAVWQEIVEMTEARRRLVESEHKHLIAAKQMITAERALILLAVVTDIIRKHVHDQHILAAVSADLRALTVIEPG